MEPNSTTNTATKRDSVISSLSPESLASDSVSSLNIHTVRASSEKKSMLVDDTFSIDHLPNENPVVAPSPSNHLHRKLEARHLQMIALGGTIGTGLFIGSGSTIAVAGPLGVLIAYSIVGIMVYAVVSAIGEMNTQIPVSGAFGEISSRFVDPALGFALGWTYYLGWLLTIPTELAVFGNIPLYWAPDSQAWYFTLVGLIMLIALNFLGVKAYGEVEYWLSFIKITAICIFIVIGLAIVCGANSELGPVGFKNWNSENVPNAPITSFFDLMKVFTSAFFSYGGSELIGVTAGEAKNPSVNVPKAIKGTFWRILFFYIVSLLLVGLIIPMNDPSLANITVRTSPFTRVLQYAGLGPAPDIMNVVILIAVFSAANGAIYASTRTLQGLAANGMAPQFLVKINNRGVPINSIIISSAVGAISLIGAYVGNGVVFNFLVNILSISILLCWMAILFTHLRFRWGWRKQGRKDSELIYKAPFYPFFDLFGLFIGFMVLIFYIRSALMSPFSVIDDSSLYVGIPLALFAFVGYKLWYSPMVGWHEMDFDSNLNGGIYESSKDAEVAEPKTLFSRVVAIVA